MSIELAPVISAGLPLAWQTAGVADVDGDGKADLIWRNSQSGDVAAWFMSGAPSWLRLGARDGTIAYATGH